MWYIGLGCSISTCGGSDYRHRILYSESANGIDWSPPVLSLDIGSEGDFDSDQVYAPDVVRLDDEYWMFYCGRNTATTAISQWNMKIGLAASSDGIYFNKHSSNPLIPDGVPGSWNDYGSNFPSVIVYHDTLRVYYSGLQDTTTNLLPKIGYSFMESSVLSSAGYKESIFKVLVFPNPADEFLNVRLFESPTFPYRLTLYDPKGNIVFTKSNVFQKELRIPLNDYSKGTYTIICQYNGRTVSQKVIVSW